MTPALRTYRAVAYGAFLLLHQSLGYLRAQRPLEQSETTVARTYCSHCHPTLKNPSYFACMKQMNSHSYHSALCGSRTLRVSPQLTFLYQNFCRQCDICPTCRSSPPTAHTATPVPAPPAPAPAPVPATAPTPPGGSQAPVTMNHCILPQLPIQFFFTLFLIETQLTGDWHPLIMPYAACFIVFYL
ncbi:hypothetical protein DFH07DRAFT_769594 [Mycena maculata]|uniref:Uncharacterized protein n=1 Tax=Mycena maculata TaxID=230809 RepID=A0AAD7NND3_9AGAR|nr:hypothetical protein DFH07DRAFT_769594 [Mycena maculata]